MAASIKAPLESTHSYRLIGVRERLFSYFFLRFSTLRSRRWIKLECLLAPKISLKNPDEIGALIGYFDDK